MHKVKALINYQTTDQPWGGSNSFLSALKSYFEGSDAINVVKNKKENFDLMLLNTAYSAPGKYISLRDISHYRKYGYPNKLQLLMNRLKKRSVKIVLRLDGLRKFYSDTSNVKGDSIQLSLINYADVIIFQSRESMDQFKSVKGNMPVPYFIIHNGVNQSIFNIQDKRFWNKKDRLNVFATSWSSNPGKGFTNIAELSLLKNVTVNFAGNWPEGINRKKVNVKPPMSQELLAAEYVKNDIFFFPSQNEACPNVVYEALSCGLPVIYHPSGGTPEIAAPYGVALSSDLQEDVRTVTENYDFYIERIRKDLHVFSIDYAGGKYADVFQTVVSENRQ